MSWVITGWIASMWLIVMYGIVTDDYESILGLQFIALLSGIILIGTTSIFNI